MDNTPGTSATTSPMFAMSGDGTDDVTIPVVFLFYQDASELMDAMYINPALEVTVTDLRAIQQQHESGTSWKAVPTEARADGISLSQIVALCVHFKCL
jgi:hypothetical protein